MNVRISWRLPFGRLLPAALLLGAPVAARAQEPRAPCDHPPRKVIVGTVVHPLWRPYPGVAERAAEMAQLIERVHADAREKYGRPADIVALPECALTAGRPGGALERALPFEGPLRETFAALARKHRSYLVLAMDLLEDRERGIASNALLLLDRDGAWQGTYRKVHLVYDERTLVREGGMTPAWEVPVFECDFGRLGLQICWDIEFDEGWDALRRKGADLVIWSSMSPVTVLPRARAARNNYYIVSSQWRENATVFEPTGLVAAQVRPPREVLAHEIDLSFAVIGWHPKLEDGRAFARAFGDRIGFRYVPEEDAGLFWSNDPRLTVGDAMRQLGFEELRAYRARVREQYRRFRRDAGVPAD